VESSPSDAISWIGWVVRVFLVLRRGGDAVWTVGV
jgi:hypothetical protein